MIHPAFGCNWRPLMPHSKISRRKFVQVSALAAGLGVPVLGSPLISMAEPSPARDPDSVLALLLEGNARFVRGEGPEPRSKPQDFEKLASGQAPLAAVLGCADSR